MTAEYRRKSGAWTKAAFPQSYLEKCARTRHLPISADYAVWLVVAKGLRPAVVPEKFSTDHLDMLPLAERQRWLKTARRRHLARRRQK